MVTIFNPLAVRECEYESVNLLSEIARDRGIRYFLISFTDLFGTQRAKMLPAQENEGLKNWLGVDFISAYLNLKHREWRDYCTRVSDWELTRSIVSKVWGISVLLIVSPMAPSTSGIMWVNCVEAN
jgi:glutamine synthetase